MLLSRYSFVAARLLQKFLSGHISRHAAKGYGVLAIRKDMIMQATEGARSPAISVEKRGNLQQRAHDTKSSVWRQIAAAGSA
jgi:hypothetical protein